LKQLAVWLAAAAQRTPQATALRMAGESLSYAALAELVVAQGRSLPDVAGPLAQSSTSSRQLALAAYAAAWRGRPFFPLNPGLLPARRAALLAQCGALDVDQGALDDPPGSVEPPQSRRGRASHIEHSPVDLLIATSGSSGEPKCVMLSSANLAAAVAASQHCLPLRQDDVWLDCLPLYHVGGMMILHRCAAAGATVLLHQGFDVERVWTDIRTAQVSHVSLTPPMLARLLDIAHGAAPPSALQYVLVGGAAVAPELARRARECGWPLCRSYGMSETAALFAAACDVGQGVMPLPGFEVRSVGTEGEPDVIAVRGAALMLGYANPTLAPGDGLQDGWFITSDLGYRDDAGRLHVTGRRDDMLVSGGANVHPAEIEALLLTFPGVRDAAVTALSDPIWGDRLVALLVGEVDMAELDAWSRARLAGATHPRLWRRVAELPRNTLGKLQRKELRTMVEELFKHDA